MAVNRTTIRGGHLAVDSTTGAVAMAASFTVVRACRLLGVTVKFSAAPTSSENLTITKNANAGAAYDVVLGSVDPSVGSLTSVVWEPQQEIWLEPGDSVDVAYTNTNTRTYGTQITLREVV